MVLKVETLSTRTASNPTDFWFTIDLTRTGPGIEPDLRCDRPQTSRLNHIDIQSMYVCLLNHNTDTKRVSSSGTASDVPSGSNRLQCRDSRIVRSFSGLSSTPNANRTFFYRCIFFAGEPLGCFDYIAWAPSEPRNRLPDEDCGVLDRNQQWGVTRCSAKMPYVCELWPGGDQRADTATRLTQCNALQNTGRPQEQQPQLDADFINCNILTTITL
jgi:hypothetical protein